MADLKETGAPCPGTSIVIRNQELYIPQEIMVSYLNTIDLHDSKSFAIFLTWGGAGKTNETVSGKVRKILESKNQKVVDGFFSSYGKWNMRKSSRPNENDINAAKTWAQTTIKNF